jgi:predicted nucleic acid-binding Zn ribbon protein
MHSLRSLLEKFVKEYGIEGSLVIEDIRQKWDSIVGDTISQHTYPELIKNDILTILVDSPHWLHHLGFFKLKIIEKIAHYGIKDIRFQLGKLSTRKEKTISHTLSQEDLSFVEDTVRSISDSDLRERLRSLLIHAIVRGRVKS